MCINHNDQTLKNLKKLNDAYKESIVKDFLENMDKEKTYVLGEGDETKAILQKIGDSQIEGINLLRNGKIVASNLKYSALRFLNLDHNSKLVVCPTTDGTLFNEFSNSIKNINKENVLILATPLKLEGIKGNLFKFKTSDNEIKNIFSGFYRVTTSLGRRAVYQIK